jgi:hypothetical protein
VRLSTLQSYRIDLVSEHRDLAADEVWKHSAGMNWAIPEPEVRFITGQNGVGMVNAFPDQKALYRSDSKTPLAIVSKCFRGWTGRDSQVLPRPDRNRRLPA